MSERDEGAGAAAAGEGKDEDLEILVEGEGDDERLSGESRAGRESGSDEDADLRKVPWSKLTPDQKKQRRSEQEERRRRYRSEEKELAATLSRENAELRGRLANLETKVIQREANDVEAGLNHWQQQQRAAEAAKVKAVEEGNGRAVVHYDAIIAQAAKNIDTLSQLREKPIRAPGGDPGLPQAAAENIRTFGQEHAWWDPSGGDEASRIVLAIDRAVANEGYDPSTPEYFEEVEARMKGHRRLNALVDLAYLGDLDDGDDEPPPRRTREAEPARRDTRDKRDTRGGPPVGGRSDARGGPNGQGNKVYIPPELKKNLQEAGLWDDPARRTRAIKEYQRIRAETEGRR
jgi:hypothetical protein